jgi:hypothetical protein
MGRTTFEPALTADRWPWPNLDVFVLGSDVPTRAAAAPVVTDSNPVLLLEKVRSANRGGGCAPGWRTADDRDLPRTRRARHTRAGHAAVVLGSRDAVDAVAQSGHGLTFEREHALPGGSVEIVYAVSGQTS